MEETVTGRISALLKEMGLRDYQANAVVQTLDYMYTQRGNPCIVAPTGSGKSHIIAALCRVVMEMWPDTKRILILSHVKELLEQDAGKILAAWPDAPLGVWCAGMGRKEIKPVTVASIQSIHRHGAEFAGTELVIVDEAHLINSGNAGMYRGLLKTLSQSVPSLRVIGLTATPYRLGTGWITKDRTRHEALFDMLIESVSVGNLIGAGYLAPLRSTKIKTKLSVDGVRTRGGEYVESELQKKVNADGANAGAAAEIESIGRAEGRRAWLVFCVGVRHAEAVAECLRALGVSAEAVSGRTLKPERERIIGDFKAGKITALTNANVLTTGFDYPDIDLIALLRPTLSLGLYVQMLGRGMRVKSEATDCLVLDFAGNIKRHGPVTDIKSAVEAGGSVYGKFMTGDGKGEGKRKICPACLAAVSEQARACPHCGHPFVDLALDDSSDVMAEPKRRTMDSPSWHWRAMPSRAGDWQLRCDWREKDLLKGAVSIYYPLSLGGWPGEKARQRLCRLFCSVCGEAPRLNTFPSSSQLTELAAVLNATRPPAGVIFEKLNSGPFWGIVGIKTTREAGDGAAAD